MFFNAQPPEIPENAFSADESTDFPNENPVEVPSEDPLGVPAQDPLDVPSEVPSNTEARAEGIVEAHPHRMAIAITGAVLLSLLTATAVFAAKENKDKVNIHKDPKEHGQSFEYAHPPKDSVEARQRREAREDHEHAAAHPGKPHVGPPGHAGHPTPPGFEGPNGKATFTNRKMRGHQHHEDRPARTTEEAKHWQDKRMWRQEGTWPGADTWANARAKDWKAERTTWPMRGGYGGAFITQAEYEKHYTVAHDFRLGDEPKMKNGYAHFSHEGDQFVIVDPYPENWNTKWHSSDDVYLEYNQGYYLINRQHPGSPVAVMVLE